MVTASRRLTENTVVKTTPPTFCHSPCAKVIFPALLGDVVISVDTAAAEAESAGIPLGEHMAWLLIHGILHLFGYDHEKSAAAEEEMETRTKELQQKVQGLLSKDLQ